MHEAKTISSKHDGRRAVPAAQRSGRRKRRKLSPLAYFCIFLLVLLAGGLFAVFRLVRVSGVEVAGNAGYSADQVVEASGIRAGTPLFPIDTQKAAEQICTKLPLVREVRIRHRLPTGLLIEVVKDNPAFVMAGSGGYVILDDAGKVLEIAKDTGKYAGMPVIQGVALKSAAPGAGIDAAASGQMREARSIIACLKKYKVQKINAVDVSSNYQLTAEYDGRIHILLGTSSDLPAKVEFAANLLRNQISATDKGELDVSQCARSNRASFTPS